MSCDNNDDNDVACQESKRFVSLPGKKAKERARKKGTVLLFYET